MKLPFMDVASGPRADGDVSSSNAKPMVSCACDAEHVASATRDGFWAGLSIQSAMASTTEPRPESERIEFLLKRDGVAATRAWVERTLAIYREALRDPKNYAVDPSYKPLFERALREFGEWLAGQKS